MQTMAHDFFQNSFFKTYAGDVTMTCLVCYFQRVPN